MRCSIAIALLASLAAPALAQPGLTTPAPPVTERDWYGYWTLAADLGAFAIAGQHITAGVVAYAIGGPLVHVAKQNYTMAGASLAIRLAVPLGLLYLGIEGDRDDESSGSDHVDSTSYGISGGAAGLILGVLVASVVDAAVLARRTVAVPPSWNVSVTAHDGGGALGFTSAW